MYVESTYGLACFPFFFVLKLDPRIFMIIKKDWESERIKQHADAIRSMLGSMGDGEISVSAYDTAWVALLEDKEGSGAPQFPSSLQWIANNQHQDGSWGDSSIFEAHDRIINTLVCVIALKSWNIHPDKSEKGTIYPSNGNIVSFDMLPWKSIYLSILMKMRPIYMFLYTIFRTVIHQRKHKQA